MTPGRIVRAADLVAAPWRNGGGRTREIVRGEGDPPHWRLSLADVDRDGAFSDFPGLARWQRLVRGAGFGLRVAAGDERTVSRDRPEIRYSGAPGPHCRLLDGPVQALNLIWSPRHVRPRIAARRVDGAVAAGAAPSLVHVLDGVLEAGNARLSAGDTLWLPAAPVALHARAELVTIALDPA